MTIPALPGFRIGFLALAMLGALPVGLRAQSPVDTVRLYRTTQPVTVDGRPLEAAWNDARPVPLIQYTPTEGRIRATSGSCTTTSTSISPAGSSRRIRGRSGLGFSPGISLAPRIT